MVQVVQLLCSHQVGLAHAALQLLLARPRLEAATNSHREPFPKIALPSCSLNLSAKGLVVLLHQVAEVTQLLRFQAAEGHPSAGEG